MTLAPILSIILRQIILVKGETLNLHKKVLRLKQARRELFANYHLWDFTIRALEGCKHRFAPLTKRGEIELEIELSWENR